MDKNELKKLLCEAVDSVKDQTKAFADDVAAHAELGFFETRTSDKLAAALEGLGLDVTRGLARTGLRADMAGGAEGPKVAVIGELDGIVCRQHPLAVEDTGASHACGHNLQISAVYAMAAALAKTGLMKELAGSVAFLGLPAEEFIEVGRRTEMREKGELVYYGGKQEFVRLGVFDDIDMSIVYRDGVQEIHVCGENVTPYLREAHMSKAASDISAHPAVRLKLVELQRKFARENDVVLDGRDIGTYVLPDASCKIFLTADTSERAKRRWLELSAKGNAQTQDEVRADIEKRDYNDSHREFAPLKQADDAVLLDTTNMTIEQVVEKVIDIVKETAR